nr:unnamed protein product [Callosobruchus analis]
MGLLGCLENIISNNNRLFKICDKGDDTPAPSPESKKYATLILQFKICDKGDDTPSPSRESKYTRLLYCKPQLKFDFRFIPGGAQMGLLGYLENIISNNNR